MIRYFKADPASVLISIVFGSALILAIQFIGRIYQVTTPASSWFQVDALKIPDHRVGVDPVIDYQRSVFLKMSGRWTVETQFKVGDRWKTKCRYGDLSFYSPDESLPDKITLDWYRGPCGFDDPGQYRLQTTWLFSNEQGQTRTVLNESNIFKVIE